MTKRARKSSEGNTWFLVEHVLKKEEDYNIYMWIIEHTGLEFTPQKADEFLRNEAYDGVALGMLVPFGKSAYQRLVEDLVGTEELVYALMDYPKRLKPCGAKW